MTQSLKGANSRKNGGSFTLLVAIVSFVFSTINGLFTIYDELVTKPHDQKMADYQTFENAKNSELSLLAQANSIDSTNPKNQGELAIIQAQVQSNDDTIKNLASELRSQLTYSDALRVATLYSNLNLTVAKSFNDLAFNLSPSNLQRFQVRWQRADLDILSSEVAGEVIGDFSSAQSYLPLQGVPLEINFFFDWLGYDVRSGECTNATLVLTKISGIEVATPPTIAQRDLIQKVVMQEYAAQKKCELDTGTFPLTTFPSP